MLNVHEAANYVRLSRRTLERLRVSGLGPKFCKLSHRVLYRKSDLDLWIASRVVSSRSEVVGVVQ
jgi:predicted DNA-binding transcriptional regulator AlpA